MPNHRVYGRFEGGKYLVIFMKNPPNLIRRSEEILKSDAFERKFGNADVYDGSAISLKSNKIPGSRGFTDKITLCRGGKVTV